MRHIHISELDHNLLADLEGDEPESWDMYEANYPGSTVGNQRLQIVYADDIGRAGIVLCGSGSSGLTHWTDASGPKDALRRFLEDDMTP